MSWTAFNGLDPAETERLAIMSEELSEILEVLDFWKRKGADAIGCCQDDPTSTNRDLLEKELGDFFVIRDYMLLASDMVPSVAGEHDEDWMVSLTTRSLSAIKLIGKTLRHGYESCNPFDPEMKTNRSMLSSDLDALSSIIEKLMEDGVVRRSAVDSRYEKKSVKIVGFLHEQTVHPKDAFSPGKKPSCSSL